MEYGFSNRLGAIKWGSSDPESGEADALAPHKYSEDTAKIIDEEVLSLVETAHTEAWKIISENRDVLDELVRQLLIKETLNEKELAAIFANLKKAPERELWLSNSSRPNSDVPPVEIPQQVRKNSEDGTSIIPGNGNI